MKPALFLTAIIMATQVHAAQICGEAESYYTKIFPYGSSVPKSVKLTVSVCHPYGNFRVPEGKPIPCQIEKPRKGTYSSYDALCYAENRYAPYKNTNAFCAKSGLKFTCVLDR